MAIDVYETRTMLSMLEQRKPPRSFLLNTFFGRFSTFTTKHVDIDIFKGKRKLAPFVSPRRQGKLVERIGFSTRSYKPAYVKPKMETEADEFLKRQSDVSIYAANDGPTQRAAREVGRQLGEMDDMITRREEWMAAQLLNDGTVDIIGDGISDQLDFQMEASHKITLAGTDVWDSASSDPYNDLKTWKKKVAQDSGINPTDVIMGSSAEQYFMDNAKIQKLLDNRRIELGQIVPKDMGDGVSYIGRLAGLNLDLWSYDEWYVDDSTGVEEEMVPAKKIFMGSRGTRNSKLYGAIQDLDVGANAAVPRFPKSWTEKDPSVRFLMVQSAPLVAMLQPDAFLTAQVLA